MNLYLAPNGNDRWSGTLAAPNVGQTDGPLASMAGVASRLQGLVAGRTFHPDQFPVSETPEGPITVWVRGGVYSFEKPVVLGPEHSWPITFRAYGREKPVFSGARRITEWRVGTINGRAVWIADLPTVAAGEWAFRELYVNGRRAERPRLPEKGFYRMKSVPGAVLPAGWDNRHFDQFIAESDQVRDFKNLNDVEAVYVHYWIEERSTLRAVDRATGRVMMDRPSYTTPVGSFGSQLADYYFDNVFEALKKPGQWYLDRAAGQLYYLPRKGESLKTAEVFAPCCLQLLGLVGKLEEHRYVEHIRFEGITFAHTDWRHPDVSDGATFLGKASDQPNQSRRQGRGRLAASAQAACDVPGVIYFEGARHCTLENCTIEHVGWYGVEISDGCRGIRLVGNTIRDLGAGGVKINGAAARDPEVRMRETGHHRITDNTICRGGRVFHSAVGVLSMNAHNMVICHNHIFDLFYTGISCGWEWGYQENVSRDNLIAYNHIHDLGHKVLSDMGGIYTLGVQPGTVLKNNLIYGITSAHYGGWCIYPDEGSSHLLIENNICYDADRQPFHQHYGRRNVVRNNIWVFGGESVGIYSRNESHEGVIWTRNIMVSKGEPIFKSHFGPAQEAHRIQADLNLYWDVSGKPHFMMAQKKYSFKQWQALGRDQNSMVADPKFKNIDRRDFTLAPNSPAFKLGFVPIEMKTVGPRPVGRRGE